MRSHIIQFPVPAVSSDPMPLLDEEFDVFDIAVNQESLIVLCDEGDWDQLANIA